MWKHTTVLWQEGLLRRVYLWWCEGEGERLRFLRIIYICTWRKFIMKTKRTNSPKGAKLSSSTPKFLGRPDTQASNLLEKIPSQQWCYRVVAVLLELRFLKGIWLILNFSFKSVLLDSSVEEFHLSKKWWRIIEAFISRDFLLPNIRCMWRWKGI